MSHPDRRHRRHHYLKSFDPGKLFHLGSKQELEAAPLDISKSGIGCVVDIPVKVGDVLVLDLLGNQVEFIVRNCVSNLTNKDQFRCGLELVDHSVDLNALFPGLEEKA